MTASTSQPSAAIAAAVGLAALASAMGIGRFSLTPMLPLMQQQNGLSLADGSWLATANYLGYLAGAAGCIALQPRPAAAVRWGLLAVGFLTLAMGYTEWRSAWLALRGLAGVASAFVLVGTSAWSIPILLGHGREDRSGQVFAGVGIGIAVSGLIALLAGVDGWSSRATWIALGTLSIALPALVWRTLKDDVAAPRLPGRPRPSGNLPHAVLIAAACYATFGFGYIIPATYLPALARRHVENPALFGLVWPLFGFAAALSTLLSARFFRDSPRRLWTRATWVLAAGVLLPAVSVNMATLLISAACVGGSFVVITMAGIKEAMRLGGAPAARVVGVMTAAFGAGQIAGPLLMGLLAHSDHAMAWASLTAAAGLVGGNIVLWLSGRRSQVAAEPVLSIQR